MTLTDICDLWSVIVTSLCCLLCSFCVVFFVVVVIVLVVHHGGTHPGSIAILSVVQPSQARISVG